jgi:hypothetical protein
MGLCEYINECPYLNGNHIIKPRATAVCNVRKFCYRFLSIFQKMASACCYFANDLLEEAKQQRCPRGIIKRDNCNIYIYLYVWKITYLGHRGVVELDKVKELVEVEAPILVLIDALKKLLQLRNGVEARLLVKAKVRIVASLRSSAKAKPNR